MKFPIRNPRHESGEVKWGVLLWALGVPLPIVLIVFLLRGCS